MCNLHSNLGSKIANPLPNPAFGGKRSKRYKIWELEDRFHCSIIGTCLTLKELRQLTDKIDTRAYTLEDYDLHIAFVGSIGQRGPASIVVNKYLDKKYQRHIDQATRAKTELARLQLWEQAVANGEVAGTYWALTTHPEATTELLFHIFGEVHMLSHLLGGSVRVDMQELHRLKQRNQQIEQRLKAASDIAHKTINGKEQEIQQLQAQLLKLKQENTALLADSHALAELQANPLHAKLQSQFDKLTASHEHLQRRLERAEANAAIWQQRATEASSRTQTLAQQLDDLMPEKQALETTLATLLAIQHPSDGVDDCCNCLNPKADLCGQCVLYVGGRNGQHSHFRQLVEHYNGRFIYHDGGREDSYQQLANTVCRADVVLCPLDCVSHAAMYTVRQHCEDHAKKIIFIPHASLSSFNRGLSEVIADSICVAAQ